MVPLNLNYMYVHYSLTPEYVQWQMFHKLSLCSILYLFLKYLLKFFKNAVQANG